MAIVERGALILALVIVGGDRHDLPPAQEVFAALRVPADARPDALAADEIFDSRAFRVRLAALGFTPDVPRNPRGIGTPNHCGLVSGRWIVE